MHAENPHVETEAWISLRFQDVPTIATAYAVNPAERLAAVQVHQHFADGHDPDCVLECPPYDLSRFSSFTRLWFMEADEDRSLVADYLAATFGRNADEYDDAMNRFGMMRVEAMANTDSDH